jgi:hypothetical protein
MRPLRTLVAAPFLFVPRLALAVGQALLAPDFSLVFTAADVERDLLKV